MTDPETGEQVAKAKNTLTVSDQRAGSTVTIDTVSLQKPGFVVIRADTSGRPGKILASSNLVSPGTKEDLVIGFRPTAGTSYYAVLYSDDGDKKFNETKDEAINTAQAIPVMAQFSVVK